MDCGPSWISQSIRQRRIRENAFVHSDPQTNKKTTSTPFPYAQGDLQAESPHINRIQPNPRVFPGEHLSFRLIFRVRILRICLKILHLGFQLVLALGIKSNM